jgi:tetratricopeptide (TPR) repeat protein
MRKFKRNLLVALAMCCFPSYSSAQTDTPEHMNLLPEYCRYTFGYRDRYGGDEGRHKYWSQRLGPEMAHMHHYCNALGLINRARGALPKDRGKWSSPAIGELDYVIRNVNESYPLLPEILARKGEALVHIGRFADAEQTLQKAIELKPDYWPAYTRLAESFVARNETNKARDVLKQGMSRVSEPRALQRMLDELDKTRN